MKLPWHRPPEHFYLFHHVPKTAGSTLSSALSKLGRSAIRVTFECRNKEEVRQQVEEMINANGLPPQRLRAMHGHRVYYGLHRFSPLPPRYFTFLRSPAERVVSHFRFHCTIAQDPTHRRHEIMRERLVVKGEFVPPDVWFHEHYSQNMMVRFLSFAMHESATHVNRAMETRDLSHAKEFLELCWFLGFTEHSERDIPWVCRHIGVKVPKARKNVSLHQVTEQDRENLTCLVHEYESLDLAIYKHAQTLRKEQVCL